MPSDATLLKLVQAQAQVPISRATFYRLKRQVWSECLDERILQEVQRAEAQQAVLPLIWTDAEPPS